MTTWKQDRIYIFLWGALIRNNDLSKKYFYDRSDKLFFHLHTGNKGYYISSYSYRIDRDSKEKILSDKISKLNLKSSDIIELKKFDNIVLDRDFSVPANNSEDFEKRFKTEQQEGFRVNEFLELNKINIELADVLE